MQPDFETLLVGGQKDETEDSSEFILEKLDLKPLIIDEMKREIDLKNDIIAYNKIRKLIKKFKPDIVHTHASKAGTLGRLAAINQKVPVIVHTFHGHVFHSYFGKTKTMFYKTIEQRLAKKTDLIIAVSEKQKEELASEHKIAPNEKIKVIGLGFDLSRFQINSDENRKEFRKKYGLDSDTVAIGIVGRLVPVKNHRMFLDLAKLVLQTHPEKKIRFFVVGDGESRDDLLNYAKSLGLSYQYNDVKTGIQITFTSWIKEVETVLAGLDIIALTSNNEGTPVSLIEAQAANKPIVSTRVGGIENIVLEGKTALLSTVGDVNSMLLNVNKIIDGKALLNPDKDNGWNFVKEKFHYTRLVNDMSVTYYSLMEKKGIRFK
jgi:glycosyltransferase involved in cell wall biosynthesis